MQRSDCHFNVWFGDCSANDNDNSNYGIEAENMVTMVDFCKESYIYPQDNVNLFF